jgi:hypothetical protein
MNLSLISLYLTAIINIDLALISLKLSADNLDIYKGVAEK